MLSPSSTAVVDVDRMGRLVLMLSSTSSGEVFNAARAIGRVLKRGGAGWTAGRSSSRCHTTGPPAAIGSPT